jgi:starch-binding outer membrane protein, SusD/RagB family
MNQTKTAGSGRPWVQRAARTACLTAAGALTLSACGGDLLTVQDPDIINPADVQSAAGANAVRLGALARFNVATSGGESLFLLGGLFADEWINGDSFIARQEIDQRVITEGNNFLTDANRQAHRARLSAEQAIQLLERFNPTAPAWQAGEMHFVQAYLVNLLAEHYCDGLVFSTVIDGREEFGTPGTTAAAFERALGHANAGLALVTGSTANDVRVRNALMVTRGRILLNMNRFADAATAVAAVPTNYQYTMLHSQTTQSNFTWVRNNLDRRFSVGNNEGGNGLNFATAGDPRVPVCVGGNAVTCPGTNLRRDDLSQPYHVQLVWPTRETPVGILRGVDARMIEAEAQLRGGNAAASLLTLNTARATVGMAALEDAGTAAARVDQLFRERAFWQFGRGYRVGDMRRLVRQHGRPASAVFPTGAWHKGGNYGSDVTIPLPLAERNNPNMPSGEMCMNRNA